MHTCYTHKLYTHMSSPICISPSYPHTCSHTLTLINTHSVMCVFTHTCSFLHSHTHNLHTHPQTFIHVPPHFHMLMPSLHTLIHTTTHHFLLHNTCSHSPLLTVTPSCAHTCIYTYRSPPTSSHKLIYTSSNMRGAQTVEASRWAPLCLLARGPGVSFTHLQIKAKTTRLEVCHGY